MPSDYDSAHRLRWVILGALLVGTATGTLGNSLVNVALPTIMDHFSVDVGIFSQGCREIVDGFHSVS